MRERYRYIAAGIACIFSLICFISLPIWLVILTISALVYPFSLVIVRADSEVASILAAFLFCAMACSPYTSVSSLVGYSAYGAVPLALLRYHYQHPSELSKPLCFEVLTLVLSAITFVVGLWWMECQACIEAPFWLKIWPGCAALMSGTYLASLLMKQESSADITPFHATLAHYGWLVIMLFLAIVLDGVQGVFVNMIFAALLPFILETVSKIRYTWGKRSQTIFFIVMGCATMTIVPLYIFGLHALFSPWIHYCFKKGEK